MLNGPYFTLLHEKQSINMGTIMIPLSLGKIPIDFSKDRT